MTAISRAAFVVACLLYVVAAAAQPFAFTVATEVAEMAGEQVKVDVYRPYDIETSGVAVLAHGFTRDRLRDRDLAKALATAGITAVAPDLPSMVDHWGNGDALAGLVRDLERGSLGLQPTSRSRIVLIGTSAGGLATVIAASKLPGLGGWIGLDPVDRTGTGARAAAALTSPAVVLLAEPSVCNLFGSGKAIALAAPSLLRSERVRGASHCDFEVPTTKFCRAVCGRSADGMAAIVRSEAVEATLEMLHDSPDDDTMTTQPDNH
jgi:pimeloyl-ACP methyl ester carboxylesterase